MSKKMLIDATHSEETRVVVVEDGRLEELDVETSTKKQIKGNIYLAKVIRVEPSLQAAFVEYGGNRHGFLAFNEIHPDYYQLPADDLEKLKKELASAHTDADEEDTEKSSDKKENIETVSEVDSDEVYRPQRFNLRKYRIQDVIHHGRLLLVQVIKEERGNKGAALTTYLSLAGRYSVYMPKNENAGGVSKKIINIADRKRLKKIVEDLPLLEGSVIIRTAGKERTKAEIKRDFEYLNATWLDICLKTEHSTAPALIHEEGNLIKRTLRDELNDEIEEVLIEGEDAYKSAKLFIKQLMPRWSKKVKEYTKDEPLFQAFDIEGQMEEMNQKNVYLKSGGYIVIDQTEALVAIDVNSGRATRERNIEETALNTNLEAADEVARQLRLRDLAGLVVIDFIDMDETKNNYAVERRMKEALRQDKARVQMGKITGFGLMEISRQRLRSSFLETRNHVCPMCQGNGFVRSCQSCAMHALHVLESAGQQHKNSQIIMSLPTEVALYILNHKRANLTQMEEHYEVKFTLEGDDTLVCPTDYRVEYRVLPQKQEKKGFFARALSSLLPVKKADLTSSVEQEKVINIKEKELSQENEKKYPKSGLNRSKKQSLKGRPIGQKRQLKGKTDTSVNEKSEVLPGDTVFKVVEQTTMQDFETQLKPTEENTLPEVKVEKEIKEEKKTRKKSSKTVSAQKDEKKATTRTRKPRTSTKKEVKEIEKLPKMENSPVPLEQEKIKGEVKKEDNPQQEVAETSKTGWWDA